MKIGSLSKLKKLLVGALPLLLLYSSCTDEKEITNTPGGKDALVTFALQMPGTSSPSTRSLSADNENQVKEIDVLAFKKNGGEYVYQASCGESSIKPDENNSRLKTFTVTLRQGEYDLVVFANSRAIINGAALDGLTKIQALAALKASMPSGGKWVATASASGYKPFPMWGDVGTITVNDQTDLTGSHKIMLTRMVARVDVVIPETVTNFKLTSVDVYNYNTEGSLVPTAWDATTDPDAPKATAPNIPASSTLTEGPIVYNNENSKTEINTVDNNCASEIYIFEAENHTGAGHATAKGLTDRTCLVIGGVWDANGNGNFDDDGDATYYRVDFSTGSGVSQSFIDVLRNHKYTFSINKVSGPGYEDSYTAFTSGPVNIEAAVVQWNDGQGGNVYIDGQYYLSIKPKTAFEFYKEAGSDAVTITTDVPDGWKITKITEADGMTTNTGWLTTDKTTGTSYGIGETPTGLNIYVSQNDGSPRTGYIFIKAGRVEAKLIVNQSSNAQVIPVITALLKSGGTTGEIPRSGGTHTIEVRSNVASWVPVLYKSGSVHPITGGDVTLSHTGGSDHADVTFTLGENPNGSPITYTIHFMDTDAGSTAKSAAIAITHNHKLPGTGGGGTPPTSGVPAPENILAVNNLGQLNLDGQTKIGTSGITSNYIVYFKWGSVIAISAGTGGGEFESTNIAWVPEAYNFAVLKVNIDGQVGVINKWLQMYYEQSNAIVTNYAAGTGDPCKLAIKNSMRADYKMPSGNTWFEPIGGWTSIEIGGVSVDGRHNSSMTQFYPSARWYTYMGYFTTNNEGMYWSSYHFSTSVRGLSFGSGSVTPNELIGTSYALPVRCVPE